MTGIVAVIAAFSLYVITHWVVCRCTHWRPYSRVINLLWICFVPVYGLLFYVLANQTRDLAVDIGTAGGMVNFLNGGLLDVLLLVGYTYFFFLIERGISLRLVIEIYRSQEGKMTVEDIKKVYTYDYILDKRLGMMLKIGYLKMEGDAICNTEKGRRLAEINKIVRRILRLKQVMP